ncbi:MAG: D-tyrosyl-tRNA(Tyr) deacylase [Alistipes sp.]|nr:D-tyrosyl-tRNA(Tyr) deacylase [Candidatus Alistipes equi]
MRSVIQRVKNASVTVDSDCVAKIGEGLLVLVAVEDMDTEQDIEWLSKKIAHLRIFDDADGVMNLDVQQINGNIIVVSQFTLFASCKRGNRPSYIRSSKEDFARPMYEKFVKKLEEELGHCVQTGIFGADMQVALVNDGPVTICIDTKQRE